MADSIRKFKINKLIRDKIPSLMRNKGIVVHERNLDDEEFIFRLKEKLIEEANEVKDTKAKKELVEELADILEVFYALIEVSDVSPQEIENFRLKKKYEKGGFYKKIFTSFIEIKEDNPSIEYYLSNKDQYPEISYQESSCIFCNINTQKKEEIVTEFKHCFVIKDQFPVSKGHLLIVPYEHTPNCFTASEETRRDIMNALSHMKISLDKEYSPNGYNIGANCGEFAGQTIMHLHMHLIPRYIGDMENPKGGVRGVIPSKQKY